MSSTRKITLKPSNGKGFSVDEAVALQSKTIKCMIEDGCADSVIPLPDITSMILAKILEYCTKHVDAASPDNKLSEDDLKAWDTEFIRRNHGSLIDLTLAAKYLDIQSLLGLTVQTMADKITPEELKESCCILVYLLYGDILSLGDTPEELEEAHSGSDSDFEVFADWLGLDLSSFGYPKSKQMNSL